MEFRADADGPRGARHPQRHRHCACDGRVGGAGCRRRATGWYERVQLARQLRLSAAQAVDRRRADATSDRGHDRRIRSPPAMTRLEATRVVVERARDAAIVASLGHPAYDLFAAGDRPRNFYTWGSMGLASSIGLGVDLEAAARAMRIHATATVRTVDELAHAIDNARRTTFIVAKVRESAPTAKPPLDCVFLKQRFMDAMERP